MRKLQTKLKKLTNRSWSVSWEYRILKIRQLIVGWINYYRIENFMGVCRKLDKQIKFRIRMCLWKKWKTNKSREKQLIKLEYYHGKVKRLRQTVVSHMQDVQAHFTNKITNNLHIKRATINGSPVSVKTYFNIVFKPSYGTYGGVRGTKINNKIIYFLLLDLFY